MDRAQRVMHYLKIMQGQPPVLSQAAAAEAGPQGQPPVAQPDPSPTMKWCDIHKVNMKRRGQNGEHWYSHKVGESWCRGESESV